MAYNALGLFSAIEAQLASSPEISLSVLSQRLRVERHTLEKAVRGRTGKSFREFRRELRLSAANSLLSANFARSIKEVSLLLGYKSPQAFARFVKTSCGLTPSQVRQGRVLQLARPVCLISVLSLKQVVTYHVRRAQPAALAARLFLVAVKLGPTKNITGVLSDV